MNTALLEQVRERCTIDGQHWLWTGATNTTGMPIMRWRGKCRMVRRVVIEAQIGRTPMSTLRVTPQCDLPSCVSPECLVCCKPSTIIQRDSDRGILTTPERRIHYMRTRRANSKFSEEAIRRMREATGPLNEIAAAEGAHPRYVHAVRRGLWRREMNSPFEGLIS